MSQQNKSRYEDVYSSSAMEEKLTGRSASKGGCRHAKAPALKKSVKKRLFIALLCVAAALAILLSGFFFLLQRLDYNYNSMDVTNSELGFEQVINKKIINIALFGVDTRNPKVMTGNTDSIMVLSLNTEAKTVKIVSVMRDSLVEIENKGVKSYRKVNSAYASGGPELAIKTLNKNFNLDISEYATVNFHGMAKIIDAVGGIDVELTKNEAAPREQVSKNLNDHIYWYCKELGEDPTPYYVHGHGVQHLNGVQAVAYSRIRYMANIWGTTDDYGRTERQRYVMEQLFNKATQLPKSQYLSLIKALIPYTETSLSVDEVLSISFSVLLHSPSFEQSRIPLDEYKMRSIHSLPAVGSYVYYDKDYAAEVLHAFLYEDIQPADYMAEHPVRTNDWYGDLP